MKRNGGDKRKLADTVGVLAGFFVKQHIINTNKSYVTMKVLIVIQRVMQYNF